MVSSLCERQVGNLGPPQTTLSAKQQCYLGFICEIPKCKETVHYFLSTKYLFKPFLNLPMYTI